MKLFFWGQFNEAEFAQSFCATWRRLFKEVEHFSYRKKVSEVGVEKAVAFGIEAIRKYKPAFVVNWQGNSFDANKSLKVRKCCEEIGAKFVYISLDDPFHLHHAKNRPYAHAQQIVTCCLEAKEIYKDRTSGKVIFAPPPCSVEYHITETYKVNPINGVFYFFTNPYVGPVFRSYGALNRFDSIKALLSRRIKVGLASVENLKGHKYLKKSEWAAIDWKGFVPYTGFNAYRGWALHFNSAVVGQKYTYLNQRVFEILGIGCVQTLDVSDKLRKLFEKLCTKAQVDIADIPFIFYTSSQEMALLSERYLRDPEAQKKKRVAARKIRHLWTFDHLVRRIALDEKTVFDEIKEEL